MTSALAAALLALGAAAATSPALAEGYALGELSPGDHAAIERGLDRLAELQGADRISSSGAVGDRFKVASTSLAGLAFLAAGEQADRGRHAGAIRGAIRYLLSPGAQRRVGAGKSYFLFSDGEKDGRMHGHGYAVLFLAQVYGQSTRDEEIRARLKEAVRTCEAAQVWQTGGYGYTVPGESGHGKDEASVTVTQIQALRAARNIGIQIDARVIDRAVAYVKHSMGPDGSVCYSLTEAINRRTYELTAAAVSTLNASGAYRSPELARGLSFMRRRMGRFRSLDRASENFYFYGNLYAAQAMFQAGDEEWRAFFPSMRQALIDKQRPDGGWADERYGEALGTACALLILQLPKRYLPIMQR